MRVTKLHNMGNHLMIDGFSSSDLKDCKFIEEFLLTLTKKIKMNAISSPLVISHVSNEESESGVTGTIILAESNITIHTYPNKKWFALDIYSCKEFDVDSTIKFLIDKLKITKFNKNFLKRGFYDEKS